MPGAGPAGGNDPTADWSVNGCLDFVPGWPGDWIDIRCAAGPVLGAGQGGQDER